MGEPVQVADTSFLYALFSKSDAFHGKARRAAASADAILVPSEIFAETVSLIHYRVGFAAAKSAGSWIRLQKRLEVAAPSRSVLNGCWESFARHGDGSATPTPWSSPGAGNDAPRRSHSIKRFFVAPRDSDRKDSQRS